MTQGDVTSMDAAENTTTPPAFLVDGEFGRVVTWLARWGYGLVDSDGEPVSVEQIGRLAGFYAGQER